MTFGKRVFDLVLALSLAVFVLPMLALLVLWMALREGRPYFYYSERMKTPDKSFRLIKIRTMKSVPSNQNRGVSGGDKTCRVSAFGHMLRRTRLDEIPQLWNVIKGDLSFVGPRPPLRRYVEKYPLIYAEVLKNRPGITGLASVFFHRHEERLLADCHRARDTETVYCRRCVPRKARLDLIYQKRRGLALDLWLIFRTGQKLLPGFPHG